MSSFLKIHQRHLILIGIFVVLSFLPTLNAEFVNWDDQSHVTDNRAIAAFDVREMFTQTVQKIYIPLTAFSFAVERKLFGSGPFVYHLDNLLLHLVNSFLVYLLVLRLGVPAGAAFWAALLFGIHPMRVESVAWVTERKDLLYAFFYLLALLQYQDYLTGRRWPGYALTLVWGILSLLSKPMALSLPLILFLMDWFHGRRFDRRSIMEKIPFFAYVIPITWITYALHVRNPISDPVQAALTWIWTFNFYLWKFFWPQHLVPVYHIPEHPGLSNPLYVISLVFFIAFIAATFVLRRYRWWIFTIGFYLLSIFFVLRFDVKEDINIVADRFMYLPSLGFCVLVGLSAHRFLEFARAQKRGIHVVCAMMMWGAAAFLSLKTVMQTNVWNNTITLWTHVIRYYPTEFLAHNDRAVGYITRGFYDLGIGDYTAILKFDPDNADAFYNRGLAFEKIKKYNAAIEDFKAVIRLYPHYEKAHLHLGMALESSGDLPGALEAFSRTIAVSPDFPDGHFSRGNIYNKTGNLREALRDYDRALELNPRLERVYNNRGTIYAKLNDPQRALKDFDTAIAMDPRYADAYYNRSVIYQQQGRAKAALEDALKARQLGIPVPDEYIRSLR